MSTSNDHRGLTKLQCHVIVFTVALLLSIPLAALAAAGSFILATVVAIVGGPFLAWMHENL